MTVGEIREAFAHLPPSQQVTVYVEGTLTVSDATGDHIPGFYSGMLEIGDVVAGEVFTAGRGWETVKVLKTAEEL